MNCLIFVIYLKLWRFTRFIKNLYLCQNEPVKMDTGNLFHGVITNAMRRRVASAGFRK